MHRIFAIVDGMSYILGGGINILRKSRYFDLFPFLRNVLPLLKVGKRVFSDLDVNSIHIFGCSYIQLRETGVINSIIPKMPLNVPVDIYTPMQAQWAISLTICPNSLGPFCLLSYYIDWVKTSWTYEVCKIT